MNRFAFVQRSALLLLTLFPLLSAADFSSYRGFQLGMSLMAAVKHSGMDASEVQQIRKQPDIQELRWTPKRFAASAPDSDPVQEVFFSFYNGHLFRISVDYANDKTAGLSTQDMIDLISARHGKATPPVAPALMWSPSLNENVAVVACWQDSDYSFNLVQSAYGLHFGLIAFSRTLDASAQAAIAAANLSDQQSPAQQQLLENQTAIQKLDNSRRINKSHFLP